MTTLVIFTPEGLFEPSSVPTNGVGTLACGVGSKYHHVSTPTKFEFRFIPRFRRQQNLFSMSLTRVRGVVSTSHCSLSLRAFWRPALPWPVRSAYCQVSMSLAMRGAPTRRARLPQRASGDASERGPERELPCVLRPLLTWEPFSYERRDDDFKLDNLSRILYQICIFGL